MKRWMRKLFSVLMCLALVLSLGAAAFAEPESQDPDSQMTEGLNPPETLEEEKTGEVNVDAAGVQGDASEVVDEVKVNVDAAGVQGDVGDMKDVTQTKSVAPEGMNADGEEDDNEEGDNEEGDNEEGDNEEGDNEEGDNEEGDNEEGDVEEGDSEEGDNEEGDNEEGDNEEGDVEEGDSEEGDNEEGDNEEGSNPVDDTDDETGSGEPPAGGKVEFTRVEETGSTSITYGETELTGTEDASCLLEYSEDGRPNAAWGWSASDGMLSLANCDEAQDINVKEGNLTIQAAGLNRINTLVSDSVVNIIGSGIMLLEEAKLGEKGEVNLLTNDQYADTGVEGSVAVFLRQKDAQGETYKLINGPVSAILDGIYSIPSGVNLIIPDGSSFIMNSTVATKKEGEDNRYQYYSGDTSSVTAADVEENAAQLTIKSGASLTIEDGASFKMISTESIKEKGEAIHILTPMLEIENGGKLVQNGKFTGTGGIVVFDEKDCATVEEVGFEKAPVITVKDTDALYDELKKDHSVGEHIDFDDLKAAWDHMHSGKPTDENAIFVFKYKDDGGNWHTAHISKNGEEVKFPGSASDWAKGSFVNPYTGAGLMSGSMVVTGVGLLTLDIASSTPGKNADGKPTFVSTGSTTILPEKLSAKPEPAKPEPVRTTAAKTQEPIPWRVVVTENPERGTWTLSVYAGDVRITDLGVATVRARFKFNLPNGWDGKNIYVVFLDKNGNLRAIPAAYNAVTGELVFDSNLVGEYVVVTFNYKGELYSKDFYTELEKLDAVKHLIDLHSGKAG